MARWVLAVLLVCLPALGARAQSFSDAQRAEIVQILRQALKADPSILREAVGALAADDERAQKQQAGNAISAASAELAHQPEDAVAGNPHGDVTLIEFSDIRCPYCRQLEGTMAAMLAHDPGIRLVYKDLPILGPASILGAKALLAAARQQGPADGYARLRAALMHPGAEPSLASIRAEADRAGLDGARLVKDMDDPAIQARIDANLQLAERLGIHGTPALVVGGTLIPGAVSLKDLTQVVDAARSGHPVQ